MCTVYSLWRLIRVFPSRLYWARLAAAGLMQLPFPSWARSWAIINYMSTVIISLTLGHTSHGTSSTIHNIRNQETRAEGQKSLHNFLVLDNFVQFRLVYRHRLLQIFTIYSTGHNPLSSFIDGWVYNNTKSFCPNIDPCPCRVNANIGDNGNVIRRGWSDRSVLC